MATSHESETAEATSSWNIVSEDITVGRPFYVLLTARNTKTR